MVGRRWIAYLLIAAMLAAFLSLTGCQKGTGEKTPTEVVTQKPTNPVMTLTVTPTPEIETKEPRRSDEMNLGDTINGFKVISREAREELGGAIVCFEHEKTGAQLVFVDCADEELTFGLAVRTPVTDDSGVAHILEHCLLSGSEKYPDSSLLRKITSQTYYSFLNAYTAVDYTYFPVASYSEEQLFVLMDAYVDGIFHPLLLKNEYIMWREGIHYEMENANAPLTASGVVYDEMISNNVENDRLNVLLKGMYPGSNLVNIHGGKPSEILHVTYQDVVDFYNAYYHPSNMLMMLYGDFQDVDRFLKQLDEEYLCQYDRKEIVFPEEKTDSISGFVELPIENKQVEGSSDSDMAIYAFAWNDNSLETQIMAELVANSLNDQSSDFWKVFAGTFNSGDFFVKFCKDAPLPILYFELLNASQEEIELFRKSISIAMDSLTDGILDEALVKYYINQETYQQAKVLENINYGVTLFENIAYGWARYDSLTYEKEYREALQAVAKAVEDGTIDAVIEENLINSEASAFLYTVPKYVRKEELDTDYSLALADIQKKMSKTDLNDVVEKTKAYEQWVNEEDDDSVIAKLRVIDPTNLTEEIPTSEVKEETKDGIRYLSSEVKNDETFTVRLYLDANGIPFDSLHDVETFVQMLGNTGTKSFSKEELREFRLSNLTEVNFELIRQYYTDADSHQYLVVTATGMKDQIEDTFQYIEEVLLTSDMSDAVAIYTVLNNSRNQYLTEYNYSPISFLQPIAYAIADPNYYLDYYLEHSMDYQTYMYNILFADDAGIYDTKAENLEKIKSILLKSPGAIVVSIGDDETIEKCTEKCGKILKNMKDTKGLQQNYLNKKRYFRQHTGIINNSQYVQYNCSVISLKDAGYEKNGKLCVLGKIASDVLFNIVREKNQAYFAQASISDSFVVLLSIADPCVKETFDVYDSLGDTLRNMEFTKEQIDGYILSCYALIMPHYGPVGTAEFSIENVLFHANAEIYSDLIHEMKSMTPGDVKDLAAVLDILAEKGKKFTIGNQDVLEENTDFFDEITW